jgi:hypothetical protein
MVRIKFTALPETPIVLPSLSPMASKGTVDVSVEHRESSTEQLDTTLADEQAIASTEATSERDVGSKDDNVSDDTSDGGNAFDNGGRVKIGAEATLTGVRYDFGWSKVTSGHISDLENSFRFFLKGFARPPGIESVPVPKENEAAVFEDFFIAVLHIPLHHVLLDILRKFRVQLQQLTPNAIVQISKFIWTITSCRGRPNAEVFAHHYELHYRNKKIHLEGSETTFAAQFGCISFRPSWFRNRVRLTPATRNKWTSSWDSDWFYCKVPSEQRSDF